MKLLIAALKYTYLYYIFLSVLLSCSNSYAQINLKNGLVASYSFTGNANDTAGNGYDGRVNNAILTTDRFGCPNSAYQFSDTTDYIDLQNFFNSIFTGPNNQFTISVWIKPDIIMTDHTIVDKVADGACSENGRQFYFRVLSDASVTPNVPKIGLSYNINSTQANNGIGILGSTIIDNINAWYHVVVTYDGTISDLSALGLDRVQIYVNNSPDNTKIQAYRVSYPYYPGPMPYGTAHLGVGINLNTAGQPCGSNSHFFGKQDDILFYNRIISPQEVSALYNEGPSLCPAAAVDTIYGSTTYYLNNKTYRFYVDSIPGITYKWVVDGDTIGTGGSVNVTWNKLGTHIIACKSFTGNYARSSYELPIDAYASPLPITPNLTGGLFVTPNPGSAKFTVTTPTVVSQLTVYNSIGIPVQGFTLTGTQTNINLTNTSPGIYYFILETNEGSYSQKIQITQ